MPYRQIAHWGRKAKMKKLGLFVAAGLFGCSSAAVAPQVKAPSSTEKVVATNNFDVQVDFEADAEEAEPVASPSAKPEAESQASATDAKFVESPRCGSRENVTYMIPGDWEVVADGIPGAAFGFKMELGSAQVTVAARHISADDSVVASCDRSSAELLSAGATFGEKRQPIVPGEEINSLWKNGKESGLLYCRQIIPECPEFSLTVSARWEKGQNGLVREMEELIKSIRINQ